MILLSWIILSASCPPLPVGIPPPSEINVSSPHIAESTLEKNAKEIVHSFIDSTLYFGAGTILGSAAVLAKVGWAACQFSPWASTYGNECLLSSHIFTIGALQSFAQVIKESPLFSFFVKKRP